MSATPESSEDPSQAVSSIRIREYQPTPIPHQDLSPEDVARLRRDLGQHLKIAWPTPDSQGCWVLESKGWVGTVPLASGRELVLEPRIPLRRLFGMLEYAFDLQSFKLLPGLAHSASIDDFYSRLAKVLAERVLERTRQGLHKGYVEHRARRTSLRGRLDLAAQMRRPWKVDLPCVYSEHTADIEDNRILAWTLLVIARGGRLGHGVTPVVRRACRALRGVAAPVPYSAVDCVGRVYHRLNEDYAALHALCRFFLEHSGPLHAQSERRSLPFLVSMPLLFELFVARWLMARLPDPYELRWQEDHYLDANRKLRFEMDMVIYDRRRSAPVAVIDAKYKTDLKTDDLQQIIAYAYTKGCLQGILVYPTTPKRRFAEQVREIDVRTMVFALEDDLEASGKTFLMDLLKLF